ncbi:aldehyde-activating protein [Hahella sp. CCB-MM4]|uniref:GFA family protein n=1 Tax=Hahella sp. (strain CCB-MM4) TaxID=1926491 RepID=UPI000B9A65A2|nr:GFA family protein [Hahella sp. CCB-MM4]OZG71943.1 aldehyde-activating protein [Hahella sp. CCB-MM4]
MRYTGSCHCGAVKFEFESETIEKGLRCNCSICRRKGAVMSAFVMPPEQLKISADDNALAKYEFGSCIAKHYYCNHCGIYTFHQTFRKPGHYRVNLGCLEELDSTALPFEVFDGASL